tara:strand:+ start:1433 stop:1744 length:312 start_codon:yes stop_codon:yes gene_type:complete
MMRHEEYMKAAIATDESGAVFKQDELGGTPSMVDNPPHYNKAGIECIEAIRAATGDGYEYYLQGNIIKYLWRYRYKNGTEDLKKAQWYLNKLIKEVEGGRDES